MFNNFNKIKVAIVCDWLTNFGGAERVILSLHKMFPEAPIFTSIFKKEEMEAFSQAKIVTSFIQKLPWAKNKHRMYLKLMPLAFEQFDLSNYDIVISSSHSCAKGVITKPETMHVCYCHTPMRYVWDDFHDYLRGFRIPGFLKGIVYSMLSEIRIWDRLAADRVDYFIANSTCVQKRISKYYRRESEVIFPPVDLENFKVVKNKGDYFLAVGRLIPYKRFDLLVETANKYGFALKIVGEGRELKRLKSMAKSNVEFLGRVEDRELTKIYAGCKGLLFPQFEDFGIVPLEAMASGKPVIAYKKGGVLDTVTEKETGILFAEQSVFSLGKAIEQFEKIYFDPMIIRKKAEEFSEERFQKGIGEFIKRKWEEWGKVTFDN